jgi:hypothetical protein
MEPVPSAWPFFLSALISFTVGSFLGRLGNSRSWKPAACAGAGLMGLGEPAILILYSNGMFSLNEAFRVGAGLLVAGTLGFGFGLQRYSKMLIAQQAEMPKAEDAINGLASTVSNSSPEVDGMGTCPSCSSVIPLASSECTTCTALFGGDSKWKINPR